MSARANIQLYNEDCLPAMKKMQDNEFDLAIVDPPYGIGVHKMNYTQSIKGGVAKRNDYSKIGMWDENTPNNDCFLELFRVSKNQIIWGGNYFELPKTKSWIVWDKKTAEKYSNDFADGELAWNSFDKPLVIFRWMWSGMLQQNMKDKQKRIHPTEKPIKLYEWLLQNYSTEGDKILDTHLGSGSIAIACWDLGFDLVGYEIDEDYFEAASKRLENHKAQLQLF